MKDLFKKIYWELYWIKEYYSIWGSGYSKPKIAQYIPHSLGCIIYSIVWISFMYLGVRLLYILYFLLILSLTYAYDFLIEQLLKLLP